MKNLTQILAEFDSTFNDENWCSCGGEYSNTEERKKVKDFIRQSLTELVESCPIGIIIADKGSVNDKMIILDEWKEKVLK